MRWLPFLLIACGGGAALEQPVPPPDWPLSNVTEQVAAPVPAPAAEPEPAAEEVPEAEEGTPEVDDAPAEPTPEPAVEEPAPEPAEVPEPADDAAPE